MTKKIIIMLSVVLPLSATAQVVHLDCTAKVTEILGESLYGESRDKVGDDKGPYLVDVDFTNGKGKIGRWSSDEFSTDPNDPSKIMQISESVVSFGVAPPSGDWTMKISRKDLSFWAMIGYGATEILEGSCEVVEEREKPKTLF